MTINGPVVPRHYATFLEYGTPALGDGDLAEIITCIASGRVFLVNAVGTPNMVGPVAADLTNATTDKVWFRQGTGVELVLDATGSGTFTVNVPTDFTGGITENGNPIGGGGGGFAAVRQAYTTSTSGITIPTGANMLTCMCWGGAGGGGGGALNNAGALRCGGGGGGGASMNIFQWYVSDLSGTLTVTIGAGGTGGSGATTVGATPNAGGNGGLTTVFGTWKGTSTRLGYGYNALGGNRSATGATATGGGAGTQGYAGGIGGNGQATGAGSIGSQTSSSTGLSRASHGGGGGGGVNTTNTHYVGGASFGSYVSGDPNTNGGSVGGGNGGNESAGRGSDWDFSRSGGGGGGGNNGGSGGDGGNGGYGAGGGGGGGGTWMGVVERGGNGGNGGDGLVVLYWT